MWQAGILILYLIHYVHTGNDPRCPVLNRSVRCKSYLKVDQCQTDTNCHGGKVCCPQKCGKDCVTPIPAKPRPGVCPSVPKDVPEICKRIRVISNCHVDTDCRSSNQKCCRKQCGNFVCTDPIKGERPGCPVCFQNQPSTDCPVCVHFQQLCYADTDCKTGQMCCFNPSCGTSCRGKVCPKVTCPTIKCSLGLQKDEHGCEICKCKQDPCPQYLPLPPWLCSDGKPEIFYIEGVKCYGSSKVIPCNKDCRLPKQPGPCRGSFPRYYFNLKTNKCDKFTYGGCQGNANNFKLFTECRDKCIDKEKPRCGPVCAIFCPFGNVLDENNCPTCRCKTGCKGNVNPLGSISCDSGQQRCPARYQCNTPSAGGSGVCCPYECPLVRCSEPCPYGYVIDENGCQTCECKPRCPPVCLVFCPFGNVYDENNCATCTCKTGCSGNVKPLPSINCGKSGQRCPARYQCNTPPTDGDGVCCPYVCPQIKCSRPCPYGYKNDVNGCQTCQCLPACEKGTPQGTCRIGPFPSTPCPSGTYCKNSVCCKIPCKFGDPHPTLSCGMVIDSNKCPAGYSCLGGPADEYFACCPDEPRCPPVCLVFCPFGNVNDENNCATCTCKTEKFVINHVSTEVLNTELMIPSGTDSPPAEVPTQGCSGNVKPLPSINCGKSGQRCPARYQCNTPSTDGDGVCCPYVCPQIKCSRPCPYGYKYDVNGCQTCQCLPACEKGTPQGTCRIGPFSSTPCPPGTYCKNSVCCKIPCKFGDPHPTLSCGMVIDSNKCPAGYSCLGGPADEYFACCPDENKPTPDKCPIDRYPWSRCYVRRSCRNDSSCLGNKKCCKQGCQYKCVDPVY